MKRAPRYTAALPEQSFTADWTSLMRTFIKPDSDTCRSAMMKYMEQIIFELHDFLSRNVGITSQTSLKELATAFSDTRIPDQPEQKLSRVIKEIIDDLAPNAVNVASPYFVGHMTSAIPFFMLPLKVIVTALNQNVVKLETSKAVSLLERQTLARIHRLIYEKPADFYATHAQNTATTLGGFTDGGTAANMTALWVARNRAFGPVNGFDGIEAEGLIRAYAAHDVDRSVILVSRRGHYSLRKIPGILGIGNKNVIPIAVDAHNRTDVAEMERAIETYTTPSARTKIIAVIGIAGSTETGCVDDLHRLADICQAHDIHFHVDAAWGGPTLMSDTYAHLLSGVERADSVTIDGHKQFYMPMGCGMVMFRNPEHMNAIAYHANYVNRRGSVDLGIKSIAGSREANSLILASALNIMGRKGYGLLIDHGIELAREFADLIRAHALFELTSAPELNILTYRVCPPAFKAALDTDDADQRIAVDRMLNEINRNIQRIQRENGKSFVSRTAFQHPDAPDEKRVVLRSVLMNPMTDIQILKTVLDEQVAIFNAHFSGITPPV
ncbi:MAG: putative pyridoxal-dependent aspartate 1-decarboxylase [Deltaproteobacteria bacterium]|nr:MAG: putative pyridoxal-dependent aspartate 1-decarboxylase [Deltaproteobacteria bacterium]